MLELKRNCFRYSSLVLLSGAAKKIFDKYLTHARFELLACGDQQDGHACNGVDPVVNNVSNDQPKVRTKYSVPQTAFFKGIVSRTFLSRHAMYRVNSCATCLLDIGDF